MPLLELADVLVELEAALLALDAAALLALDAAALLEVPFPDDEAPVVLAAPFPLLVLAVPLP